MAHFRYEARDREGKAVKGVMEAPSQDAVAGALASKGHFPVKISQYYPVSRLSLGQFLGFRIKPEEINQFTRQLWAMQKAGIPIITSLRALQEETSNKAFKEVLAKVMRDLEEGESFSSALSRHPRVFSNVYVNGVRAGEISGKLEQVLFRLLAMGEFEAETRRKIQSATRYPLVVLVSLALAFTFIVAFVIPQFSIIYSAFRAELPLPTRVLMELSRLIRVYWLEGVMVLALLVFLFRLYVATKGGRYRRDYFVLKVPVVGRLVFYLLMGRFSRFLSELLASGVSLLQALQLVSESVGNAVIEKAVRDVQENVSGGKSMAEPMKQSGFFSTMVVQMVAIGEQTGKVDELLGHISDYYDEQANYLLKDLSTFIEPVLIVLMGGMVLALALGVFLPIWDLVKVVK
ncbi:MAG: type II secretion system F family protein [Candidatus Omnitrophica bacterium]|nr:type II secretion system F family protein [Candidatus Omnitrophota bacterium]